MRPNIVDKTPPKRQQEIFQEQLEKCGQNRHTIGNESRNAE
jgi:hypothetical protein